MTPSELVDRFRHDVVGRGDFAHDWFTGHIESLEPILASIKEPVPRLLEIGSFEGLSTCYFLWRLPAARVTCVDTFQGSPGLPSSRRHALEEAFDRNIALVDPARVRKLVGDSRRVLLDLAAGGDTFDLVYVDGSHLALDVLVDAALSWPLVAPGGVVIFDDYLWAMLGDDSLARPGPAVDAFIELVSEHAEVLVRDRQVALRKMQPEKGARHL